jgi:hypothetical protein
MKRVLLGSVAGAVLAIAAAGLAGSRGEVLGQQLPASFRDASGAELIAVPGPLNEKGQLLTVIDPRFRSLSVYQIDRETGKVELRSVRTIHWDLQMTEFNSASPLPGEIRALLEQR